MQFGENTIMKISHMIGAALFFLFFIGCEKQHTEYSIEEFMNTLSVRGSSFSNDERSILFSSDKTGIFNAYVVGIQSGQISQLTNSDTNSIFTISFFPNDDRILYRSDQGGNELYHIFVRNTDGSVRDLTQGIRERAMFYGWAHDEKSFYYGSNRRDPRYMDVYEMDINTFNQKLIFNNNDGYSFGSVSNDERFLSLEKTHTRYDSDIYLYHIGTGELQHISSHDGDVNHEPLDFTVDSKGLHYLTDLNSEFKYLLRFDIGSGETTTVHKEDWDIWYSYSSYTGRYRVDGINADSQTKIRITDTEDEKVLRLPRLPAGDISSVNISKSEKKITFYHSGARSPSDLYVMDLGTKNYQRLTSSRNPDIDPDFLADAKIIRYRSFDGMKIPAVYYRPHQASANNRVPALVWVHGGPGGQSRVGYRALIQYIVNHGYAVLAVNNRGSSGYGKTFQSLDDQAHGEGDLDDCVWAKEWLKKQYYIDQDKIGIIGGSYGGYMVMAALAFRPDVFDVGVNIFGVTNWVRTLKSIPPWWESFRLSLYKEMGDPNTMEDYLYSISPLFHSDNIIKPVLVLQGANDPRVLQIESDEMVKAIKDNGVPIEYVVFDDEGHGFVKKSNQITANKAILSFLDNFLQQNGYGQ